MKAQIHVWFTVILLSTTSCNRSGSSLPALTTGGVRAVCEGCGAWIELGPNANLPPESYAERDTGNSAEDEQTNKQAEFAVRHLSCTPPRGRRYTRP